MKIVLKRHWGLYSKGNVIPDAPTNLARELIRNGTAEEFKAPKERTLLGLKSRAQK